MSRYAIYVACVLLAVIASAFSIANPDWRWVAAGFGALALLGTWDLLQRRSTLRRNYPILAHFRYGLESIGPEMRQYFIESDTAEVPFSRQQRAWPTSAPSRSTTPGPSARSRTCTASTTNGSTISCRRCSSTRTTSG